MSQAVAFEPSYVTHGGASAFQFDAPMAVSLLLLGNFLQTANAVCGRRHREPVIKRLVNLIHDVSLGTAEMSHTLKNAGLPVSGLAEIMNVERKTVYAWLSGSDARIAKLDRLEAVYRLFRAERVGALKLFHRHWDRPLDDGVTLHGLLTADVIDIARVRVALDALRPSIDRAMERERKREADGQMDGGPSGLMNLHMAATTGR